MEVIIIIIVFLGTLVPLQSYFSKPTISFVSLIYSQFTAEQEAAMKAPIVQRFEEEGSPYYASARQVMTEALDISISISSPKEILTCSL